MVYVHLLVVVGVSVPSCQIRISDAGCGFSLGLTIGVELATLIEIVSVNDWIERD